MPRPDNSYSQVLFTDEDASSPITSDPIDVKEQDNLSLQVNFSNSINGFVEITDYETIQANGDTFTFDGEEFVGTFGSPVPGQATFALSVSSNEEMAQSLCDQLNAYVLFNGVISCTIDGARIDIISLNQDASFTLVYTPNGDAAATVSGATLTALEGSFQRQVSNENGRIPGSEVITITLWNDDDSPVVVDAGTSVNYYIPVSPALGNWYRIVFTPSAGSGSASASFSAKN